MTQRHRQRHEAPPGTVTTGKRPVSRLRVRTARGLPVVSAVGAPGSLARATPDATGASSAFALVAGHDPLSVPVHAGPAGRVAAR